MSLWGKGLSILIVPPLFEKLKEYIFFTHEIRFIASNGCVCGQVFEWNIMRRPFKEKVDCP